jgi:hypothetical protein
MPTDAMQKHNPNIERSDCVRLTLDCQFAEDFVLTINSWTAEGNTQHEKIEHSIIIFIVAFVTAAGRAFGSGTVAEPRTEELRGDLAALGARLMPTYRDVTLNGKAS